MSASDKKKLRKEQTAAVLSEKQRQEQAEAKKLKAYTIAFVSTIIALACVAVAVLGIRAVNNSGVIQRNTIAATVGDNALNTIELSYYYNDAINNFYNDVYNNYSDYADSYFEVIGLDTSKPLDEQTNSETNKTWAEYFVDSALEQAKNDYAMYEKAIADNFELPAEEQTSLDNQINNLETYAMLYGYSNSKQYLRAMYGYGADAESYGQYMKRAAIASAYVADHEDSLTYDDAAIREYEADKISEYNSYTYSYAYLSYTDFRQGGTEDEGNTKVYSAEENDAARELMKTAAEELATATSVEELKEKAANAPVNEDSQLAVNTEEAQRHSSINSELANWLAAEERKEGDIAAIANSSTTTAEDGTETTVTNGYYVAIFHSMTDNTKKMSNVRHLLVKFEGGTTDEESGETVYTEEEKAAAKEEAEGYLKTWQEGEATEDTFIELVEEHSDDSSASTGGLFENIHPDSSYVENFLNWSISADRKVGDAEVIETEYGYHVMYYAGDAEMSYRDYIISEELRAKEHEEWYQSVLEPITTAIGDLSKMKLDLIINPA